MPSRSCSGRESEPGDSLRCPQRDELASLRPTAAVCVAGLWQVCTWEAPAQRQENQGVPAASCGSDDTSRTGQPARAQHSVPWCPRPAEAPQRHDHPPLLAWALLKPSTSTTGYLRFQAPCFTLHQGAGCGAPPLPASRSCRAGLAGTSFVIRHLSASPSAGISSTSRVLVLTHTLLLAFVGWLPLLTLL